MGVRRLAIANGPNIFQMLLVYPAFIGLSRYIRYQFNRPMSFDEVRHQHCNSGSLMQAVQQVSVLTPMDPRDDASPPVNHRAVHRAGRRQ